MRRVFEIRYAVILVLIGGTLCIWGCSYNHASAITWPVVVSLHKSVYFPDAPNAEVKVTITSNVGKPLYLIECHTWRYLENYVGNLDFYYSGDFECRLTSLYSIDRYSTLFTEDLNQPNDWDTRARFFVHELKGKCADYPEYGRIRHFYLRGMKITFTMDDINFTSPEGAEFPRKCQLKSFRFSVSVDPDSSAVSEITEHADYLPPPYAHPEDPKNLSLDCDVVRKVQGKKSGGMP